MLKECGKIAGPLAGIMTKDGNRLNDSRFMIHEDMFMASKGLNKNSIMATPSGIASLFSGKSGAINNGRLRTLAVGNPTSDHDAEEAVVTVGA